VIKGSLTIQGVGNHSTAILGMGNQRITILGMDERPIITLGLVKQMVTTPGMGKQPTAIATITPTLCGVTGMNGTTTIGGNNTISSSC
jgi:hypothetical protein